MDTVRVIHDEEGRTLTVWFGDAQREHTSAMDEHGVVVMKDQNGRAISVEILDSDGTPTTASLSPKVSSRAAR